MLCAFIPVTSPAVPSFGIWTPVRGCDCNAFVHFLLSAINFSLLNGLGIFLPEANTAFRFLLPITAPNPPLPAALSSLTMQAYFTRFSPAGPMTILPCQFLCVSPWFAPKFLCERFYLFFGNF